MDQVASAERLSTAPPSMGPDFDHPAEAGASTPPVDGERRRLAALADLRIVDTAPEAAFDELAALASEACAAPIAMVTLVTAERQWFKASIGLSATETPREQAFCAQAILSDQIMAVEDTRLDPRFRANPLVLGPPHIRAYMGAPLIASGGERLGALCVIDTVPRPWTDVQATLIQRLSKVCVGLMESRAAARRTFDYAARMDAARLGELRFQTVFASINEGLVLMDRDGRIVEANPGAARILGLSVAQLLGRASIDPRWRSIRPDGSPFPGEDYPAMECLRTGRPVNDVTMGVHMPDGRLRWLAISAQPMLREGQALPFQVLVTFIDITERLEFKRSLLEKQARLEQALEAAQAASDAKTRFLANMTHEIRTPLNGVIGVADALARSSLGARQREMIELIASSGRSLERILNDVLDLSKIEAGGMELEARPFDLRAEIGCAAHLIEVRADDKGVSFKLSFGEGAEGVFLGDALRLKQIIGNLASNAVKFTQKGSVEVRVSVEDRPGDAPSLIVIEVEDTGVGFDEAALPNLFERFSQADESITRRFGGTGLGLSICKSLTDLLGGEISAHSTPGKGSLFRVSAPMPRVQAQATAPAETVQPRPETAFRVLLAEDHPTNQKVVQMLLEPYGADIIIAEDGAQAVALFQDQAFDLILMDMQMPTMDGLAATRAIRDLEREAHHPHTPIAMMTANTSDDHQRAARTAGSDIFIPKPITSASLMAGIEALLTLGSDQVVSTASM
ncbi:MAG: ATP-binding protein [Caulobacteraceae bacterium]|nr:ATP-binding protein [Caulobacteraceae bacterium]